MANGPQKPDHRGNFLMVPRRVIASRAWKHLSNRARATLLVFQYAHDGFNNGQIVMRVHDISTTLGDQNHRASTRAVADLILKGFIECTSGANHSQSLARTYRITFIPTGQGKSATPATHEYEAWRPPASAKRKFGGARTATRSGDLGIVTTTPMQFSGAVTALPSTEIRENCIVSRGAETAPLLGNHLPPQILPSIILANSGQNSSGPTAARDLAELRAWVQAIIQRDGYGSAKRLAADARVPEPVLSRFRSGKNLPERFRLPLQTACGRAMRWDEFEGNQP